MFLFRFSPNKSKCAAVWQDGKMTGRKNRYGRKASPIFSLVSTYAIKRLDHRVSEPSLERIAKRDRKVLGTFSSFSSHASSNLVIKTMGQLCQSNQYLLRVTREAFTLRDLIKCQSQACAISRNPARFCVAELRNISNSNNEQKKEKLCERILFAQERKLRWKRDEASSRKVIKCWENSFS